MVCFLNFNLNCIDLESSLKLYSNLVLNYIKSKLNESILELYDGKKWTWEHLPSCTISSNTIVPYVCHAPFKSHFYFIRFHLISFQFWVHYYTHTAQSGSIVRRWSATWLMLQFTLLLPLLLLLLYTKRHSSIVGSKSNKTSVCTRQSFNCLPKRLSAGSHVNFHWLVQPLKLNDWILILSMHLYDCFNKSKSLNQYY